MVASKPRQNWFESPFHRDAIYETDGM
jgi:hypothetical protein